MPVKTLIITGASRGLGLAIAKYTLDTGNNAVLIARSKEPLLQLQEQYKGRVQFIAGDLVDFAIAKQAVDLANSTFGGLNGLVVNHGVLQEMKKVEETTAEEWRHLYDINVFSSIAFAQAAIPSLRKTKGSIIFTSTGASKKANVAWGVYGSGKAVLDHLASTIAVEEENITAMAIAPGVVDTDMQKEIRERHHHNFTEAYGRRFLDLHADGKLLPPTKPGNVMARLALEPPAELSGKYFSWDATELAAFRNEAD